MTARIHCKTNGAPALFTPARTGAPRRNARNLKLGTRNDSAVPAIAHEVLRSSGQPRYPAIRAFLESRFGHDFSRVRVHADARAAESARAANALAHKVGPNVVFGTGDYLPGTPAGRHLSAHELTHVVQHRHFPARSSLASLRIEVASHNEQEAEVASRIVSIGGTVRVAERTESPSFRVQRQIGGTDVDPFDNPRMHPKGAPDAKTCGPTHGCPKRFCQPYDNESYARHQRTKMLPLLMAGTNTD